MKSLSRVWLFATPWTLAHQAALSMGFPRQEYWDGLPFPSPGDLPDPRIEPRSPALQADALPSEPPGKHFIHSRVCMSIPVFPIHPTFLTPLVSTHLFSMSVSLFLLCKSVHLYHFSRVHINALIYDICFSLSDLLHSVWLSLGPFTFLQMAQFHSFLWLSNSPFYIFTTSSLYIPLLMDI